MKHYQVLQEKCGAVVLVLATDEISNNPTTGYTNPLTQELPNQGIGSGAGYLEASNGTFKKIS